MRTYSQTQISSVLDIGLNFLFLSTYCTDNSNVGHGLFDLDQQQCYFRDHFLSNNILPISLIQESMLQCIVMLMYDLTLFSSGERSIVFQLSTRSFHPVYPAYDHLLVRSYVLKIRNGIIYTRALAFCDAICVAKGSFSYVIK